MAWSGTVNVLPIGAAPSPPAWASAPVDIRRQSKKTVTDKPIFKAIFIGSFLSTVNSKSGAKGSTSKGRLSGVNRVLAQLFAHLWMGEAPTVKTAASSTRRSAPKAWRGFPPVGIEACSSNQRGNNESLTRCGYPEKRSCRKLLVPGFVGGARRGPPVEHNRAQPWLSQRTAERFRPDHLSGTAFPHSVQRIFLDKPLPRGQNRVLSG